MHEVEGICACLTMQSLSISEAGLAAGVNVTWTVPRDGCLKQCCL